MSTNRIRTTLALALAGILVLVAGTAGVVWLLARDAEPHEPELTAYSHGRAVTVPPFYYCTIRMENCRQGDTVFLEVPTGDPLQLSLPSEVVGTPWELLPLYARDNGEVVEKPSSWRDHPEDIRALTVDSQPEPGLELIGVELQVMIIAIDETGREFSLPHAIWSIKTA
ncbi:DUF2771 domain-containing protein [Nocardia sp. NPDC051750]|uniref:DUF2771 domain-containing protein n=1 Tax=Nocardia sp. NPDC051750 TaxID=3364325 RepID=UPI00379591B9